MTPFALTDTDRLILSQTDDEFILHDWEDLASIIARNDLGALKRKPSDLVRYLAWSTETKAQYGSIMNYICQCRLKWHSDLPSTATGATTSTSTTTTTTTTTSAVPPGPLPHFPFNNPIPFADPSDYKILRNDWPYGVAPGINHLIVWLRTPVPTKEDGGDLTHESRRLIEDFVHTTFVARLAREGDSRRFPDPKSQVLWFKNWSALQSVRALEHVHVLVKDVPEEILREWTGE